MYSYVYMITLRGAGSPECTFICKYMLYVSRIILSILYKVLWPWVVVKVYWECVDDVPDFFVCNVLDMTIGSPIDPVCQMKQRKRKRKVTESSAEFIFKKIREKFFNLKKKKNRINFGLAQVN